MGKPTRGGKLGDSKAALLQLSRFFERFPLKSLPSKKMQTSAMSSLAAANNATAHVMVTGRLIESIHYGKNRKDFVAHPVSIIIIGQRNAVV